MNRPALSCVWLALVACGGQLASADETDGSVDADISDVAIDVTMSDAAPDAGDDGTVQDAFVGDVLDASSEASCTSPTQQCSVDGSVVCVDVSSDIENCGGCSATCWVYDAGGVPFGTNNPDSGVPYDGGIGWTLGTPTCDAGKCGVACAAGFNLCPDTHCYDFENQHDHCGGCFSQCGVSQWCNHAHCCDYGSEYCGSFCAYVLNDPNNCGGCGNTCDAGCANGACL